MSQIRVSIVCAVYNHEKYLHETIDSFLNQKCNFDFEIILHEDCSTDNSRSIIQEYERKHPKIVRPIYQTENIYSKGEKPWVHCFKKAQGDYIALCDGDDYWTDELKLQKQVDFLDTNKEYSLTGHSVIKLDNTGNKETLLSKEGDIDFRSFLRGRNIFTLSLVFRNDKESSFEEMKNYSAGDFFVKTYVLNTGKGYLFDKAMGVYRLHNTANWSGQTSSIVHKKTIKSYRKFLKSFPNRKEDIRSSIIKYKLKYKLFFKDFSIHVFRDLLEMLKIGIAKAFKK